jgi:hypothetical protein
MTRFCKYCCFNCYFLLNVWYVILSIMNIDISHILYIRLTEINKLNWIPNKQSNSRPCKMYCNTVCYYDEKLLTPYPTPSCRTTPSRLSTIAYSIYSQLISISGGCSSIHSHVVLTDTQVVTYSKSSGAISASLFPTTFVQ